MNAALWSASSAALVLPKCRGSSTGQSVPMMITREWRANASAKALLMRAPRSSPRCGSSATPARLAASIRKGSRTSGAACSSTGPRSASTAVLSVCSSNLRCRAAAPAAPNNGISRVFTVPATGALANTIVSALQLVRGIGSGQLAGVSPQPELKTQPPHQHDGAHNPVLFPAAP